MRTAVRPWSDDTCHGSSSSFPVTMGAMNEKNPDPILRIQVIAISVVGAVAVICYVLSSVLAPEYKDVLRSIAWVAGIICAVIGVSFAITGARK